MAEDQPEYIRFAGRVVFPRGPQELEGTSNCPACFAPLRATVCGSCGLDLAHSAAAELHEASLRAADALEKRLTIIGRIRYDTSHAATVATPTPEVTVSQPPSPQTPSPPPPANQTPTAAARPARHSSVQVTLLIVGISLLSVAAIFFLIYAFINFGIVWRSTIIAAITVGAIGGASILRRRSLTATAEGIAVFGVVLVYLDAFALRENDFFGLASADGAIYWGTTLLASSVAFLLWHRMSSLRTPSILGFSAFAPGLGVLVAGLVQNGDNGTRAFLVAAAVAAAGLLLRLALRIPTVGGSSGEKRVEWIISLSTTSIALVVGAVVSFAVDPSSHWSATIALVALVAIAVAHLLAMNAPVAGQPLKAFGYFFAGFGGALAAVAVGVAAGRIDSSVFAVTVPVIAAVAIALGLEAFALRGALAWKRFSTVAAWSASAVFAAALVYPALSAIATVLTRTSRALTSTWELHPAASLAPVTELEGWSVASLAIVGLAAMAAWRATGVIRARGRLLAWFGAAVLVAAVALLSTVWMTMAGWLILAIASMALLTVPSLRAQARPRFSAPLVFLAAASGALGFTVSWASTSTWWIGSLVIVALLLASRRAVQSAVAKAALLGFAAVIALIAGNAAALHVTFNTVQSEGMDLINGVRFVSIVAIVLLATFALPLGKFASRTDRRVMFWLSGATATLTLPALLVGVTLLTADEKHALLLPEYATSFASSLLLLGAMAMWLTLRPGQTLRPERIVVSLAAAPVVYLAVFSLTKLATFPDFALAISPIVSALLVSAVALTLAIMKPLAATRWAIDLGVVLVAVPSVFAAVVLGGPFGWLVLVIAGVAVLLLALSDDGLFSSKSGRRHLGWVSLALATVGLWWRLASNQIDALEWYVLPLAFALLVIAALTQRASYVKHKTDANAGGYAAPLIALGGGAVGLLPLAINASDGEPLGAVIIGAVSATLLLSGSFVVAHRSAQPWWDSAALVGALGVIVLMVGRATYLPVSEGSRDAWIVGGFACLFAAALGQAILRQSRPGRLRSTASQALGIVSMIAVLALEIPAFHQPPANQIRVLLVVLLFATVHVISLILRRAPLSPLMGWVAITFAGLAALLGVFMEVIHAPEIVAVPIAIALLATGVLHLREVPAARSWLWLAPGVLVLLLPSLIETLHDQSLWRVVGVGVIGVAVIVIGVVRRLQAPFTLGVIVVIIHAIATFLPQLRAAYESIPWWLWLGVGGVLIIVLAARYEQRIRNLKDVAMKFASLR